MQNSNFLGRRYGYQIEALELARLSRKSRPELLGRHCSISVTDEDGAGICIIPLDDIKPNVYPPHGLRLQSAIEATRRAPRKRTRGQRRSAQYLQQPFCVRKTGILIQFCTGRTGDVLCVRKRRQAARRFWKE